MRSLAMAWIAAAVLAGPASGMIHIRLTADDTSLLPGQTTTVRLWAQGTVAGIASVAGNIHAGGAMMLSSVPGTFQWVPLFRTQPPYPVATGQPATNGGWTQFGSMQTSIGTEHRYDATYGRVDYVELGSYQVMALSGMGTTTLSFQAAAYSGFVCVETNRTAILGVFTPVTFTTVPEPAGAALLGLALVARARRTRRTRPA